MALRRDRIDKEQFFTRPCIVEDLLKVIIDRCGETFTYVDCSSGPGYLPHLLGAVGVDIYAYDIDTSTDEYGIAEEKDWLSITREDKDFPDDAVVGFNPPFGFNGKIARQFIEHAAYLCPDAPYLFFIAPHLGNDWSPNGFILNEKKPMPYEAFERPDGSLFATGTSFYIFAPGTVVESPKPLPPDGFSIVTLEAALGIKGGRIHQQFLPRSADQLIIRRIGDPAGAGAFVDVDGELHYWSFASTPPKDEILGNKLMGVTQHFVLTVPSEWAGPRRKDLLQGIAPLLLEMRRANAYKRSVSKTEFFAAIAQVIRQ